MPVLNLNGTARKHGIANGATIQGEIFQPGLAHAQHGTTRVSGTSYNSPFTKSSGSVFGPNQNNSTQPALPAVKVESPGKVVPVNDVVKVHPNEKGSFFSTNTAARPVNFRSGGPSSSANTAANPNNPAIHRKPRPVRKPPMLAPEKETHLSYLRSGGTLGPHANSSSTTSRWHTVSKGVNG
jgi:hypothetical protein